MPSGLREIFRIELRLDPAQRDIWSRMEKDGKALRKLTITKLEQTSSVGWSMERGTFVESMFKEAMQAVDILHERAVRGVVGRAHDGFTAYFKANGEPPRRSNGVPMFEVDPEDVVLSSSDPIAVIPYLGSVRILPNNKVNVYSGDSRFGPTESKANIWSRLRTVGLEVWNHRYVLTMDCTSGDGPVKLKKNRRRAGSKWLDGEPV